MLYFILHVATHTNKTHTHARAQTRTPALRLGMCRHLLVGRQPGIPLLVAVVGCQARMRGEGSQRTDNQGSVARKINKNIKRFA